MLCSALVLVGCGGEPATSGPSDPADRAACQELLTSLDSLDGQPRRESDAGEYVATFGSGDQPLVLRCGVDEPAALTPTSQCIDVNGIDWFVPEDQVADQSLEATLTTVGRAPRVEVVVPAALRPPNDVLVDLGRSVSAATEQTDPCR